MLLIRKDVGGKEYIQVLREDILQLYMNYLKAKQRKLNMTGENLSVGAMELISIILAAGDRGGKLMKEGIRRIGLPQVELEVQRRQTGTYVNWDALDELCDAKIIFKEENKVQTQYQAHKQVSIFYNESALKKLLTLHEWLPVFREEICF